MFIQQIYTGCLAQASYYIESNGEAAIIDPIREPEPYINLANNRHAKIKYIFETHFHADFVSGHLDLAAATGAVIILGPHAKPAYPAHIAFDQEEFNIGNCIIKLLHTPGHTVESSCLLLLDKNGKENALFTGDTLFVGDVGRPDLMSGNNNKYELASMLYDSINSVIKHIPDDVLVYPGHGAGSACGKNLGTERFSTIGEQRKLNYAMQPMNREDFITAVTENLATPPAYFFKDAGININGYKNLKDVISQNFRELSIDAFNEGIKKGALVLDTRDAESFSKGYIKDSINIGLKGEFAPWVGTMIGMDRKLILITDPGSEMETIIRLARIGYENVLGYFSSNPFVWMDAGLQIEIIENIDAADFCFYHENLAFTPIDVRRYPETKNETIIRALNVPLEELNRHINEFDKDKSYVIFCKGGYRSMIAASLLKSNGINNLLNVAGGIAQIKKYNPELLFS